MQAYINREVQLGQLICLPSHGTPAPQGLQINPFGVTRKKNRPNKWRLIVDLSAPEGASVNDAISSQLASITYTLIDDAVGIMHSLGPGCLLAKL